MKLAMALLPLIALGALAVGPARPGHSAAGPAQPAIKQGVAAPVDFFGDPLPPGAVARLGTLRLYPGDRVWALAFAPDGKTLATGGEDHQVRLWETGTGKELRVFPCKELVGAVAFVPGGPGPACTLLASGSNDGIVLLWDLVTGKLVAEFPHPTRIQALAASGDGKLLAVGSDHEIVLWSLTERKQLRRWAGHSGGVLSLAFTPDGKGLLSGGRAHELISSDLRIGPAREPNDYGLALWDPGTGKLRKKFIAHTSEARVLGFSADAQSWATVGVDKNGWEFGIWDTTWSRRRTISCKDFQESFQSFAFAPDGKTMAAAAGRAIHLWDAVSGKPLAGIKVKEYLPLALAFSPDSQTLAAAAVLERITLWDFAQKTPRHSFAAHARGVWALAVAPDGKTAVTGSADGDAREWELATGKPLRVLKHPGADSPLINCARYSRDGKALALSYFSGVSVWDVASGKMVRDLLALEQAYSLGL